MHTDTARVAVYKIIEDHILEGTQFSDETELAELGLDSLATIELSMEIEEELNIYIEDSLACRCDTVGDLVKFIGDVLVRQK